MLFEAIDLLTVSLYLLLNKLNFLMDTHNIHVGASQLVTRGLVNRQHLLSQVIATMRGKWRKEFSVRPTSLLWVYLNVCVHIGREYSPKGSETCLCVETGPLTF